MRLSLGSASQESLSTWTASPGPSPGASTVALKRSKASVETTYVGKKEGALPGLRHGHWHLALKVRACKGLKPPFKVSFTRDSTADERSCESNLNRSMCLKMPAPVCS